MTTTQEQAMKVFANSFMDKIIKLQPVLKEIHANAFATSPDRQMMVVHKRNEATDKLELVEAACLRRGYKITLTAKTGLYELLRTNTSDYYKHATAKEVEQFKVDGWIRACDENQIKRDKVKLTRYNKKIDNANKERNDSLMTHWRRRRRELIDNISSIEEKLNQL